MVSELSSEERKNLNEKFGEALIEFEIDADVKTRRQLMC
jgi:hypothetical protein